MRAIDKLLKKLTAESLARRSDEIDLSGANPDYVTRLRAEGYIHSTDDRLTLEGPPSLL